MAKDMRTVETLRVFELQEIIKDVPKTYFSAAIKEACAQINKGCKVEWNKDLHEFSEKLTGLDTKTPESKDHIRGVYKYAEGQQEKAQVIGRAFLIEGVKALIIAAIVYMGLKQ